jgi:hypothetical protein
MRIVLHCAFLRYTSAVIVQIQVGDIRTGSVAFVVRCIAKGRRAKLNIMWARCDVHALVRRASIPEAYMRTVRASRICSLCHLAFSVIL